MLRETPRDPEKTTGALHIAVVDDLPRKPSLLAMKKPHPPIAAVATITKTAQPVSPLSPQQENRISITAIDQPRSVAWSSDGVQFHPAFVNTQQSNRRRQWQFSIKLCNADLTRSQSSYQSATAICLYDKINRKNKKQSRSTYVIIYLTNDEFIRTLLYNTHATFSIDLKPSCIATKQMIT